MSELSDIVKQRVYAGTGIVLTDTAAEEIGQTVVAAHVDFDAVVRAVQATVDTADVASMAAALRRLAEET